MIDHRYLRLGVRGLAAAHRAGTMAGHLGAAVAAGYFFGEDAVGLGAEGLVDGPLPEAVARGVEAELDRVIAGEEAIWFDAAKAGLTPADLFDDLPSEGGGEGCGPIVAALMEAGGRLRQSGHNVIFASIAVRALTDHPDLATPAAVRGVRRLMRAFVGQAEGRGYYGREAGWQPGAAVTVNAAPHASFAAMADAVLRELAASAAVRTQGFGGLWHVANHAAAVIELARYGYRDEAAALLPGHARHLALYRSLPDVVGELGPVVAASENPWTAAYWAGDLKRDAARLTHRVKTLYGYQVVRATASNAALRPPADRAFLFLMD